MFGASGAPRPGPVGFRPTRPVSFAVGLGVSIAATALAYVVGIYAATRRLRPLAAAGIAAAVVVTGYLVARAGAPPWLVIGTPIPLGIVLLAAVVRSARATAGAYAAAWAAYVVFHVALSGLFGYSYLIPAWRLRG